MLLRRHDKYGFWLSVGGHVELDEDPNEAALRVFFVSGYLITTLTDCLDSVSLLAGW